MKLRLRFAYASAVFFGLALLSEACSAMGTASGRATTKASRPLLTLFCNF